MEIKSLIIDDDPFIQDLLTDKLVQYIPEVKVADIASSGMEGLEKIKAHQPNLIFLDVEMADMTGFEMLSRLENIQFQTIFITSYSHYAIKAIRFNALDYLVKPIDLGELKAAIRRFKSNARKEQPAKKIQQALRNLSTQHMEDQKLTLNTQEGELRMSLKDIRRIEGERNYSYIHLSNNKRKLTSKTLGEFEDLLSDKGFFRCHKSHLVNISHIQSYPNSITLLLSDDFKIPVSRRKKEDFKQWYESYSLK